VRSLAGATTELISVYADGTPLQSDTWGEPDISDDGNLVAFDSRDDVLEPEGDRATDVFVRNRARGVTRMVSVADDLSPLYDWCGNQSLSADGRYVMFDCGDGDGGASDVWVVELDDAWWDTTRPLIPLLDQTSLDTTTLK